MLDQVLFHSLSMVNQEMSKNHSVTSTFEIGIAVSGGWFASPKFPDHADLFGVFPTIFALYLNDLLSVALSSILSISSL